MVQDDTPQGSRVRVSGQHLWVNEGERLNRPGRGALSRISNPVHKVDKIGVRDVVLSIHKPGKDRSMCRWRGANIGSGLPTHRVPVCNRSVMPIIHTPFVLTLDLLCQPPYRLL